LESIGVGDSARTDRSMGVFCGNFPGSATQWGASPSHISEKGQSFKRKGRKGIQRILRGKFSLGRQSLFLFLEVENKEGTDSRATGPSRPKLSLKKNASWGPSRPGLDPRNLQGTSRSLMVLVSLIEEGVRRGVNGLDCKKVSGFGGPLADEHAREAAKVSVGGGRTLRR